MSNIKVKSFCSVLFVSVTFCVTDEHIKTRRRKKQPGAFVWRITCSCHLNRLIMIITDIILLSPSFPVDLYLRNLFSCSQSRPCCCLILRSEKQSQMKIWIFFSHFQTVFKSTVTISVSTNPLNVIHVFIFSIFLGKHSGIHFDTVVCDATRLSAGTNSSTGGWMDWSTNSKLLILSFLSLKFKVCILGCAIRPRVTV